MIVVFAKCKVVTGKENEFLALAHSLAEKSRSEIANISYDILKETKSDPDVFYFMEKWKDQSGLDTHMQTVHFTDTIAAVNKIIEGSLEIHVYENI